MTINVGGAQPNHTLKVEFARNLLQLQDASEVRREVLNITTVESLARFDEVQVVFLEFPFLHRFLLAVYLAILA